MKAVFTCGGTGGHINPALAVARVLLERRPDSEILFVGAEDGMEATLVPREGFRLETLQISSYMRSLKPSAIRHNVRAALSIRRALKKADRIIRDFQPDVILGTGGYASYPMLHEGARLGIPTAVHESNAVPGLATKMVADKVDRILVSFADSRSAYRDPSRVIAVGMPVREEFVFTRRADARRALGLDEKTPMIVSAWGSLGAREMNKKIAQFMKLECEQDCWRHIHATGSFGWRWMPEYVKDLGVDLEKHPSIDMREYIFNMPTCMAAADLIICRAGAATISEVCASALPCIMVPSPNVTNNHQEKNAMVLQGRGAAVVVPEAGCSGKLLFDTAKEILTDPARTKSMRQAASSLAVVDSAQRIYETALELIQSR